MTPKLASSLAAFLLVGVLPLRADTDTIIIPVPRATLEAIHKSNEAAKAALAKANRDLADAQGSLAKAYEDTIPTLQKQIQTVADERAAYQEADRKDKLVIASKNKRIVWLTEPLAISAALLALWGLLRVGAPNLSFPWGLAVTAGLPLLVFGSIMAGLRYL